MKSLSLKVIILLMAALVLSASGCFNENETSTPEGTMKGYYRATKQANLKKILSYWDPRETTEEEKQVASDLTRVMRKAKRKGKLKLDITDVKTTLVSEKEILVWKGDKWGSRKEATVEVRFKVNGKNIQDSVTLVLLDNKWYISKLV